VIRVNVKKNLDLSVEIEKRKKAVDALVYLVGTEVGSEAMRHCPVDKGYLRSSRYVEHPTYTAARIAGRVGFSATYARFVERRRRNYRVGGANFLANARASFDRSRLPALYAWCLGTGASSRSLPTVHPTGPLVGPGVTPRRRRARLRSLLRRKKVDKLQGLLK
jgi:hypothetical protein